MDRTVQRLNNHRFVENLIRSRKEETVIAKPFCNFYWIRDKKKIVYVNCILQADIYHCGCVQGYQCTAANVGNYWGKCTEEPGSGFGEIE